MRSLSAFHSSTPILFASAGARNCCSNFSTSARGVEAGAFTNARITGSFATAAVFIAMLLADCCNSPASCWLRFCSRSLPASCADSFTARYDAQVQAPITTNRSVPISNGSRYLIEIFDNPSDTTLTPCLLAWADVHGRLWGVRTDSGDCIETARCGRYVRGVLNV